MSDWIKIHRQIRKHWIWDNPDFFRAWIDLLMMAYYEPKKRLIGNELIQLKRGQRDLSFRFLSKRWEWGHSKIKRFLKLLEKDEMIRNEIGTGQMVVTICNYDTYQNFQKKSERKWNVVRTESERSQNEIKKVKNIKNVKKENARDFEFQKQLFDKLRNRFGLMEDHYPAYRHHIEGMLIRWTDKTETLVDAFLSDKESGIRDLRYLCEQGIDKYAAPKRKKTKFRKTPNGEFVAYCSKCGNQLFYPTLKSLQTSSDCHAADLIPDRPRATKTVPQNISAQS